jgi:protein-disulfide isomerase
MLAWARSPGPVVERPDGLAPLRPKEPTNVSTGSTHPPISRRERRAAERAAERRPAPAPGQSRPAPAGRSVWRSPLVLLTGAAILVTVLVLGALAMTQGGEPPPSTVGILAPSVSSAGTYGDGEAIGPADAPVVLEVYSDYQCPWCGKFARETLPDLVSTYVAAGDLRVEGRAIAFLGTSIPGESLDAATAAACAGREGKYWAFHDYLMANQAGENAGAFRRERLYGMASLLGLDDAAFRSCLDDSTVQGAIMERTQQAFAAGINSTPTFVINGERVTDLRSYEELGERIQAKLDALGA